MKKLPRWQKGQKERKRRKTKYIIRNTLLVIFLILLAGIGWQVYHSISKSLWDGENQFNLAINSQPVLITSFDPQEKSLNVLVIPDGTFIETIHGYGSYRVESIYRLGELNGRGGELLSGSLQEYLGISVDAYISVQSSKFKVQSEEIKNYLSDQFFRLLRGGSGTNLTKWDLIRLWWMTRNIREDKITVVNLKETASLEEVVLSDGTKAKKIDLERVGRVMAQLFLDEKILKEDLTITVLNGTDHNGLANKLAVLIRNIGGRVVRVGEIESSKFKIQSSKLKCEIRSGKKDKNSYTVQKLMKVFDCRWGGEDLENQRSSVVLIVGEGYWQWLTAS